MELYLYAPNPELKPEKMMNYEIGWLQSFFGHKLNTELTAFLSNGENMIQVVGGLVPKRQNVGSFSNRGIEFAARYSVNNQLSVHANYSFLDMEKVVVAAPHQQFNIGVNYQYKLFNINLSAQHVDKLYASVTQESIQNFTLFNSRISAQAHKNLEIFVAGHNLLNETYEINYGYPMPGINFHGGITLKL
jgi:iron complex outermembrane receptor protein